VVELTIGLKENSSGTLYPDTLFIYEEKYFESSKNVDEIKKRIYEITGIDKFDGPIFDDQVEKVGSAINSSFLNKSDPQAIEIASIFSSKIFDRNKTSYLHTFVSDKNVRDAYCQKSSLSLDEILKLYKIPVRQIHWQENCSGFHQFTEYWNPFDEKWKLIDVYYGIRYVNNSGDYLGFEEVEVLLRENKFGANNILKKDIGRLYFDEKEILEGWDKADIAIRIIRK